MAKLITSAVQADADVANALDAPVAGVHVGGGRHVTIPPDFAAQVASGRDVPGCSYHKVQPVYSVQALDARGDPTGPPPTQIDTALVVSDAAQAKIVIPAEVANLAAPLRTQAPILQTKLAAGTVVLAVAAQDAVVKAKAAAKKQS